MRPTVAVPAAVPIVGVDLAGMGQEEDHPEEDPIDLAAAVASYRAADLEGDLEAGPIAAVAGEDSRNHLVAGLRRMDCEEADRTTFDDM